MSDGSSDAPLYFSMACFAVAGASFWLKWHVAQRQQLRMQEMINSAAQVQADFSARARTFEDENLQDWPHRLKASSVATRNYLLMAQGRADLRYLELVNTDRMVLIDQTILLATVVSVELQQDSETVMRVESSSEIRRKGSAGRAALGALVAGPSGAVIGAASRSTSAAAKTVSTSFTQKGPTFLVIGTSDFDRPVIKLEVPSFEIGEEWLHRIKAAMLVAARKAADDHVAEG